MGTATISAKGGDEERALPRPDEGATRGGTCGVLGQMDDDRIRS